MPGFHADPRTYNSKMTLKDDENARLKALEKLGVMDTADEQAYDDITRLAASMCETPIALITLVDGTRQWFKSRVGMQASETPREHAFCAHAIEAPGEVFVVNDASADPRFAANPLVTGDPNIRFYAGAPLLSSEGHALGTVCVIDTKPRSLSTGQMKELQFMAKQVMDTLEKNGKK